MGGVGGKTAATLLNQIETLDNLLARLPEVQPVRLREKLVAALDLIAANRQMVALDLDLPLPRAVEELKITPQYDRLIAALRECEFKGLLNEVEAEAARGQLSQGNLL